MDHFLYRDGVLHAEDVPIPEIAAAVGTPFYVYSTATLTRHYRLFEEALAGMPHLDLLCDEGQFQPCGAAAAGAISARAWMWSRAANTGGRAPPGCRASGSSFPASARRATRCGWRWTGGIRQFNVESEPELLALNEVAPSMGLRAPMAIRVNPDVDARTHEKIATGKTENKFGIPIARARAVYAEAARAAGDRGGRDRRPHRQPADRSRALRGGLAKVADLTRRCAPMATPSAGSISAAAWAFPTTRSNEAPPLPFDYGAVIRRTRRAISAARSRSSRGG